MAEQTDTLGTYTIGTTTKLVNENDADGIYLALFDNGENSVNSCRYKVALTFLTEHGRKQFVAPILNYFEPARWLRSVAQQHREQPFYRQALQMRANLKKEMGASEFEKEFSAGFFYDSEEGHKCPNASAYAYMVWAKGEQPMIGFRYYDYALDLTSIPDNEFAKGGAPKFNLILKNQADHGMRQAEF